MLTGQNQHFLTTTEVLKKNIPKSLLHGRKQNKLTGMATASWGKSCDPGTPGEGLQARDLDLGKKQGKEREDLLRKNGEAPP